MRNSLFACAILFSSLSFAQNLLSLEEAVSTALNNNYGISIAKNNTQIAKNNATRGNAGALPTVTWNSAASYSSNNTRQEFLSGQIQERNGASSNNVSSGLALTWTIFDGKQMFIAYDRLKALSELSEIQLKSAIETTIFNVSATYYDIVRQQQLIKALEETIGIYEERIKIAQTKLNIGSSSKVDVLQANVDFNTQRAQILRQRTLLTQFKLRLNTLINQEPTLEFTVTDSIQIETLSAPDELYARAAQNNQDLLLAKSTIRISELQYRELRGLRYPRVTLNANYNFSRVSNQVGFLLFSRNLGFNTNIAASWVLFDGFNVRRQLQNAQLNLANAQLQEKDLEENIASQIFQAYEAYTNALDILELESENYRLAKENLNIMLERFRLANATTLELKETQRTFDDAQNRLVSSRYDAKIAELQVKLLTGELVR